jgi:hypothetical protein
LILDRIPPSPPVVHFDKDGVDNMVLEKAENIMAIFLRFPIKSFLIMVREEKHAQLRRQKNLIHAKNAR